MALSVLGIQQELQRVLERAGANGLSGNFHFACKAKRLYGIYQPTAIGVLWCCAHCVSAQISYLSSDKQTSKACCEQIIFVNASVTGKKSVIDQCVYVLEKENFLDIFFYVAHQCIEAVDWNPNRYGSNQ